MLYKAVNRIRGWILAMLKWTQSAPPREIPAELDESYTLQGQIPVQNRYRNDVYPSFIPRFYSRSEVNTYINKATRKEAFYYKKTSTWMYEAIEKYSIKGCDVAVMGSTFPTCEAICLAYGAQPTSIEYNKIVSIDGRLNLLTVDEFTRNPRIFDAAFSISSFEHDGLGRYGDPLNPDGDLDAMKYMKSVVKPNGLLFLAVPVGSDALVWNLHRIYGKLRLPMLLHEWRVLDSFGFEEEHFCRERYQFEQPVFVLENIQTSATACP
ncbi:MAG: hypothetical protein ACI915_000144 [Gammaproteobacteria bacterium]|jgi:hypothetical protein